MFSCYHLLELFEMALINDECNEDIRNVNNGTKSMVVPTTTAKSSVPLIEKLNIDVAAIPSNDIIVERRKSLENSDEYNTIFTKKLFHDDANMNSTFVTNLNSSGNNYNNSVKSEIVTPDSEWNHLDYRGGLLRQNSNSKLNDYASIGPSNAAQEAGFLSLASSGKSSMPYTSLNTSPAPAPPLSISERPIDTSFGFQNTFKVLEKYIRRGRRYLNDNKNNVNTNCTNSSKMTTPYNSINCGDGDESTHNSYHCGDGISICDVDGSYDNSTKFLNSISEDGDPSLFELEFEARSRILATMKEGIPLAASSPAVTPKKEIQSPMNELLYGVKIDSVEVDETMMYTSGCDDEMKLEQTGCYPEYLYHIARGKDGQTFLRVMNSLMLDNPQKGKLPLIHLFNYSLVNFHVILSHVVNVQ